MTAPDPSPDPAVEGLAGVGVWLNHDDPRDEWPGINEWTVEGIAAFAADAEDVFWTAYHRTCESDGEDAGAALGSHHEAIARRILTGPELAARDAAQQRIGAERALRETCREWPEDGDRCNAKAEFILWGKLFPPEALGPRCYDHAVKHAGHDMPVRADQWAVFDLRADRIAQEEA